MVETTDFHQVPFLTLGQESLSLGKVLGYLQLSGKLFPLIQEIIQQHIIHTEIQQREDLLVDLAELEQVIIDFRLQNQLGDSDRFQQWLNTQGIDRETFQGRALLSLKLKKLAEAIAAPQLQSRFEQQQDQLAQVNLLCLVATEKGLIETAKMQITAAEMSFEQVIQSHAGQHQETVSVLHGNTRRGQLPSTLRHAVDQAAIGELVGPVEFENRWCLLQVGERLPAVLDDEVRQTLQQQLFQEWLLDKARSLSVQFANQEAASALAHKPLATVGL